MSLRTRVLRPGRFARAFKAGAWAPGAEGNKVAQMENGHAAHCFGTGMAATTSVILSTMKAGDHCVISDCSYGGTNRIMRTQFMPLGMTFDFVDFRDLKA